MVRPQLRAAVAPRAGELAKRPHLTTRAGRAQASLLAVTRVVMQAATEIVASTSLLQAPLTTTLLAAAGVAEALAAVLLVVLVALLKLPEGASGESADLRS